MRNILGEHGRLLIAVLTASFICILLFSSHGIPEVLGGWKTENIAIGESESAAVLDRLEQAPDPVLEVRNIELEIGESIRLADMVTAAVQGEGEQLKEKVRYYLEDGTEVDGRYQITGKKPGILQLRFFLEGNYHLQVQKEGYVRIHPVKENPQISELIREWDIGEGKGQVKAKLYGCGEKEMLLAIQGRGTVKKFTADTVPWNGYREEITECRIEEGVETEDMDGWFFQHRRLRRISHLPKTAKSFRYTFAGCTSLTAAGIPKQAVDIEGMYQDCTQLQSGSSIPGGVKNCTGTFRNCTRLRGALYLEAIPDQYAECFANAAAEIEDMYLQLSAPDGEGEKIAEKMIEESLGGNRSCRIYLRRAEVSRDQNGGG